MDSGCLPKIPRLVVVGLVVGALLSGACAARNPMNDRPADHDPLARPPGAETIANPDPEGVPVDPSGAAGSPHAEVELGPTDPDEFVDFTISLVLPGERAMRAFIEGLYDPRSPDYRRFLDAAAFGERFGLPLADVDAVVAWLTAGGLEVVARPPQRTSLNVRGRVRDVNRLLGVTLVDWQTARGQRFHRPDAAPVVPAQMDGRVAAIVGLDSEPAVEPAIAGAPVYGAGVPNGGLRPEDVRRAYEIEELHAAGLHGEGQTVAIISFDTFDPADIAAWDAEMGITGPPVEAVRILDASTVPGDDTSEVHLDIEVIRGIAPATTILDYEAPNRLSNFGPLIARIVQDGRADLVNISWGKCEKYYPPEVMAANEQEFAAAFAAGISIFVASGDDGAYGCKALRASDDPFERDISVDADSPTTSPSVVSVGGTFLSVRQDGTYYEEAGWEEPLSGGGGGGGVSSVYPRPSWQQGVGVDNSFSNGRRQVPDVAGPGDSQSGFIVIYTPPGGERIRTTVGGTSAAAPFWVASMTLARQLGQQRGIDGLGALAPTLYQLAAERPDVFHDVVKGGNLLHQAGAGWDYSTGLGTPRVGPLANALVDLLSR